MTAAHTPGPWEVRKQFYIHVAQPDSWSHAEVKCSPGIPAERTEEHEANARLIAAAPDLLAAIEAFLDAWSRSEPFVDAWYRDEPVPVLGSECIRDLQRVVAKATGMAP